MAERISPGLARLLRERKIVRSRTSKEMVLKEFNGAVSDLNDAKESLQNGKFKWGIIQGYYSIFHSARALLYSRGFREKGHRPLLQALRELFGKEFPASMMDDFEDAMSMREAADYGLVYSEEGAQDVMESAEGFLDKAKTILREDPLSSPEGKRFKTSLSGFRYKEESHEASRYLFKKN